jgi:hypothetical protein
MCTFNTPTEAGEQNTRGQARDKVVLLSGEEVPCAIRNTNFVFRTAYARLEFLRARCRRSISPFRVAPFIG